ncbi:MAG: hypothetical protein COB02_13470 [Candidatus Cloacimonadota bacterium]|nr:MAG: hypothetical protein COB02_13470 [Candidatus Cloacimonadota bacterium]
MNKNILRLTLCSLFCVSKLICTDFIFIEPQLIDLDRKASPRNIQKVDFEGQKVLSFNKVDLDVSKSIKDELKSSKLIEFVGELRKRARVLHHQYYGNYATADQADTPIFTYLGEKMGLGGPAVASGFRILINDNQSRSDSLLILPPMKLKEGILTIQDFIDQKYFSTMLVHELFHGIMGDIYGNKMAEMRARSYSRVGHSAEKITDPFLAYMEGMAEAMELAAQEMFASEVSSRLIDLDGLSQFKKDFIKGFKKKRLVIALKNKFGFSQDGKKLDGVIDSAEDQLNTEGVIASLCYRVLFKSNVEDSFDKVLQTLVVKKPLNFMSFIKSFVELFPEDKSSVIRQFLESTHYATVSSDAARLYQSYYLDKKEYKKTKDNKKAVKLSTSAWKDFRLTMYNKVLDGTLAIDNNFKKPFMVTDEMLFYTLDLNSSRSDELYDFFDEYFSEFSSENEIQKIIVTIGRMQKQGQKIIDMDSVEFSQKVEESLAKHHQFYINQKEKEVQTRLRTLLEGLYSSFVDKADVMKDFLSHSR